MPVLNTDLVEAIQVSQAKQKQAGQKALKEKEAQDQASSELEAEELLKSLPN